MSQKKQSQKNIHKRVTRRNQQICLNKQINKTRKAYLNKKQLDAKMKQLENPKQSIQNQQYQSKNHSSNSSLIKNSNRYQGCKQKFNQTQIEQKLNIINQMIFKIERNQPKKQMHKVHKYRSITQYKTEPGTLASHSYDDRNEIENSRNKLPRNTSGNSRSVNKSDNLSSDKKRIERIKSNRNKLKVYNPFPFSFSQVL